MDSAGSPHIRVTATVTRGQATAVLRSVPWVRRALVQWLVALVLFTSVGPPFVVAVTGSVALGGLLAFLGAVALGQALLLAPWSRPRLRPLLHGVTGPVTWTFSPDGLHIESAVGLGYRPWSSVDLVAPRGDLLVVGDRGHVWATGVPLLWLPPGAVERVVAWHAGAPAPVASEAPSEAPSVRVDGIDLVVVGAPTVAQVREPLLTWARTVHRYPVPLALLAVSVGLLAWAASSGDVVRARAAWLTVAGLVLLAAALEVLVRVQTRTERRRVHGWRVGEHTVGCAVDGAWQHVPWPRVARVTVTRSFLVIGCRDLDGSVVVPLAGVPGGTAADILTRCRTAGVDVRGRRVPDPPASDSPAPY